MGLCFYLTMVYFICILKEKSFIKLLYMEIDILLENLRRTCEELHSTWRFAEEIAKNLIVKSSQKDWGSCKVYINESQQKEFGETRSTIEMLRGILIDAQFFGVEKIEYSDGFVIMIMKKTNRKKITQNCIIGFLYF